MPEGDCEYIWQIPTGCVKTIYYTLAPPIMYNHLKMDPRASTSEGILYTFNNELVNQNYFATADSRNYYSACMGLPGWCPCINCTASATSSSINDNEPNEVTQVNNAESKPLTHRPLSLNQCRKRVPSEECSESLEVATGSKKPPKSTVADLEERFIFNIDEDDLETFKKGECSANTTKSTEWAMKNFALGRIACNAEYGDLQSVAQPRLEWLGTGSTNHI